jgi:hypothetical protein
LRRGHRRGAGCNGRHSTGARDHGWRPWRHRTLPTTHGWRRLDRHPCGNHEHAATDWARRLSASHRGVDL